MTGPLLPENWEELTINYVLDDLSTEEAEDFRRLLATNPEVAKEVVKMQETFALMPYALPQQEPPAHLRSKILEAAQANTTLAQPSQHIREGRGHRFLPWQGIASSIAALLVLALGVDSYRLRQELRETQQTLQTVQRELIDARTAIAGFQQPDTEIYSLQGIGDTATASGHAVINPNQQEMVIAVQNLPSLPSGQVYRLWAIAENETEPIYCGQFSTDQQGTVSRGWNAPSEVFNANVSQLLITTEAAAAPPLPEGPLVMQSIIQSML